MSNVLKIKALHEKAGNHGMLVGHKALDGTNSGSYKQCAARMIKIYVSKTDSLHAGGWLKAPRLPALHGQPMADSTA